MIAKAKKAYRDRITGRYVLEGDTVELSDERAAELAKGGFVSTPEKDAKQPKGQFAKKGA